MPDCGFVDSVEPLFHPWKGADEDETDRQQQNRFASEKLPEIARGPLARGPRDQPQDAHAEDEDTDRRWPDISGNESTTHVATLASDGVWTIRQSNSRWCRPMHPKPDTGACASPRGGPGATPAEH